MKKNRPGVMVSVLCDEPKIPVLEEILFPRDDARWASAGTRSAGTS